MLVFNNINNDEILKVNKKVYVLVSNSVFKTLSS